MTDEEEPRPLPEPPWIGRVRELGFVDFLSKYRRSFTDKETGLPLGLGGRAPAPYTIERLAFETAGALKLMLKLFTPFCLLLFAISFAWDPYTILRSCSIAGLIGFGTNWIAVKMLFWPREIRPIFGQGLIPSQRDQIIEKVTQEVIEKLINEHIIREEIIESGLIHKLTTVTVKKFHELARTPEFQEDVRRVVLTYTSRLLKDKAFRQRVLDTAERRLDELSSQTLKEWLILRFKQVWKDSFIAVLERELLVLPETMDRVIAELDQILEKLPRFIELHREPINNGMLQLLLAFVRAIDVRAIVEKQLADVTSEQLEKSFLEFAADKLSYITLLGGILGFVGGFVIIWPIKTLLTLAGLLALLTLTDFILYPLMRSRFWPTRPADEGSVSEAPEPTAAASSAGETPAAPESSPADASAEAEPRARTP